MVILIENIRKMVTLERVNTESCRNNRKFDNH